MEDNLVFAMPRETRKPSAGNTIVRLSPEAWETIEAVSAKTGYSNAYVASQMVMFAAERTVITFDGKEV